MLHEDLLAFVTQALDLPLEQVDLFGDFRVTHGQQFFDDVVDVDFNLALHDLLCLGLN